MNANFSQLFIPKKPHQKNHMKLPPYTYNLPQPQIPSHPPQINPDQSQHPEEANSGLAGWSGKGKRYSLKEKMDNLKPSPKYLSKYDEMNIGSDRWLDRLVLYGYPVANIINSVFTRLALDSRQFMMNAQRRAQSILNAKDKILHYIPSLPLHYLPQQSINHLSQRYKIPPESCKLLLIRYSWAYQKPRKMYQTLSELNVRIKVLRESGHQICVVFATKRMRDLYLVYGDVVNLEYQFVPLRRSYNGMHYNLGVFVGQDQGIRPVIFGIALLNGYHYQNVKTSIRYFLQIMDSVAPKVLITSHQQFYSQILQQLNTTQPQTSKIHHQVNNFHTLQKWRSQLPTNPSQPQSLSPQSQHCLTKISTAITTHSLSEYESIVEELRSYGCMGEDRVREFLGDSQRCCCVGVGGFVGGGVQEGWVGVIRGVVRDSFFYVRDLGMFYILAFRMQHKCNSLVQQWQANPRQPPTQHKTPQLRHLSTILSPQIFTKLLHIYTHSLTNLQILPQPNPHPNPTTYKILDTTKPTPHNITTVHYNLGRSRWECCCGLVYRLGLPCQHLVKIVRYFGGSLGYYVGGRWVKGGLGDLPGFEVDQDQNTRCYQQGGIAKQTYPSYQYFPNKYKPLPIQSKINTTEHNQHPAKQPKDQKQTYEQQQHAISQQQ